MRDGTDHIEIDLGMLAGVSDRGHVHTRNEDALGLGLYAESGLAAVICDGVSSTHAPERAARAASEAALDVLLADPGPEHLGERRVRDAVAAAARAVTALAGPADPDGPSCTVVAAFVDLSAPARPEIAVAWVGDSRAYWLAGPHAPEPARRLTNDHSWAVEMVNAELLDESTALADPRAHIITRWLGEDTDVEPDVVLLSPTAPGVLLLCSDGMWNYLPEPADLAAVARPVVEPDLEQQGERDGEHSLTLRSAVALTTAALDAGGRDNVTVAVIPIIPRSQA